MKNLSLVSDTSSDKPFLVADRARGAYDAAVSRHDHPLNFFCVHSTSVLDLMPNVVSKSLYDEVLNRH